MEDPGVEYAYQVYFGKNTGGDNGYLYSGTSDSISFVHPYDAWFLLETVIDLDNDLAQLYLDGTMINEWQWSLQSFGDPGANQLGGIDFYAGAPDGVDPITLYDDLEYIELVAGIQEPILEITGQFPIFVALEQWEETTETFEMANAGEADLNYDIVVSYPSVGTKAPIQHNTASTPVRKSFGKNLNIATTEASPAQNNPTSREVVLHYDGESFSAVGQGADYEYIVAALFPSDMVQPYIGMTINQVDVFVWDPAVSTKVQIFGMGEYGDSGPGELLYEQEFQGIGGEWNTIMLDEPFLIDGQDISVGWWLSGIAGTFVPGTDEGPADPNGNWIATNGGPFSHLSSSLDYNWNIRAYADGNLLTQWLSTSPTEGTLGQDESIDVDVMINTANLAAEPHQGLVTVRSNDSEVGNYEIDVFVDVTVGVNEFGEKEYVAVYPNPAKDVLRVKSNGDLQHVRLMNSIGQIVFDQQMSTSNMQINIGSFDTGVYFIQIETEVGTTTQKIIIE